MKDYSIANDIDGNSKECNAFYWQRGWNSMATKITEKNACQQTKHQDFIRYEVFWQTWTVHHRNATWVLDGLKKRIDLRLLYSPNCLVYFKLLKNMFAHTWFNRFFTKKAKAAVTNCNIMIMTVAKLALIPFSSALLQIV